MTDVLEQIEAKLAELPDSPDAIAARMRDAGVKGHCYGGGCPVYHWLHREIPDVSWVTSAAVCTGEERESNEVVLLPSAVVGFVSRFDDGQYPELLDGSES